VLYNLLIARDWLPSGETIQTKQANLKILMPRRAYDALSVTALISLLTPFILRPDSPRDFGAI